MKNKNKNSKEVGENKEVEQLKECETLSQDEQQELQKDLQKDLQKAQEEIEKYKDQYIRVHADFENSKKRLEKDKIAAIEYSNETFAKDVLNILDSIENAILSTEQIDSSNCDRAIEKFKEGLQLILDQTVNMLKKHGVEEIEHTGMFDPNFHQVLMQVESEKHDKDEIVQVMQKGYKMKDRVIRPAMVSTSK